MNKRHFLKTTGGGMAANLVSPGVSLALTDEQKKNSLKVGIITDLHFGNIAPDALDRLTSFGRAVGEEKPDYVIQLGDFCHPEKAAGQLMKTWNEIPFPKHHVLGNHDMDKGTKSDIRKLWGMKKRYYDFDLNGWKFIIIDMNHLKKGDQYIPYANANFYVDPAERSWPDPEQLEWLDTTLSETKLPVLIYTHQPFTDPKRPQHAAILEVIKKHRESPTTPKVRAVICGHEHQDWHKVVHQTHHICINSASYLWADGGPWPYEESLFAFLEIKNGKLSIQGRKTSWKKRPKSADTDPMISDRTLVV